MHKLAKGTILPILTNEQLIKFEEQIKNCSADENYWVNEYQKISILGVPWGSSVKGNRNIFRKRFFLNKIFQEKSSEIVNKPYYIVSVFLLYFFQLMNQRHLSVRWLNGFKQNEITEGFKILNCTIHPNEYISNCITYIIQKIVEIDNKCVPLKDFAYRYDQENIILPIEIAISDKEESFALGKDTLLQIILSQESIYFRSRIPVLSRDTLEHIISQFFVLILDSLDPKQDRVRDIPLIDNQENIQLANWNKTQITYQYDQCIHQIFEDQATKLPDVIAVSYEANQITYDELNRRANQLARHLQTLQHVSTKGNRIIGILIGRSLEMVISMLACLKSGFAYLPIDTDYPEDRINYIFQDAQVSLIITNKEHLSKLSSDTKTVLVDDWDLQENDSNLGFYELKFLVYVLYTSGSTGLPKGSGLTHESVSNLLNWYKQEFAIEAKDNILVFTAFGFDLTQKNILGGLIAGAKINLLSNVKFDPSLIIKHVSTHFISFINCPPSAFYAILGSSKNLASLNSLRIVLLGGEAIKPEKIRNFLEAQNCKIINTYGPTECSDLALTHELEQKDVKQSLSIPLGRNVGNVSIYILNKHLNKVPIGCLGEVHIGGASLGIGYLNRATLTAERFIANLPL